MLRKQILLFVICIATTLTVNGQSSKQLQKAKSLLVEVERCATVDFENHQKAVDLLTKVADRHDENEGEALLFLGEAYSRFVPGVLRNDMLSLSYYTAAAEKLPECPLKGTAFYNMAFYYYKATEHQELPYAHDLFVLAAKYNDALSSGAGQSYEFGLGCPMNPSAAFAYYKKGIAAGADLYAMMYAIHYYMEQTSANTLDTIAYQQYRDGILEQSVGGRDPDLYETALLKSALRGYLPAQFEYGTLMMRKDVQTSMRWLKSAADRQYLPAIHQYGVLCESLAGHGIREALPFYQQAAEAGYPPAQCAMGVIYQRGLAGVPANVSEAKSWYEAAAEQGYKRASKFLDNLDKSIRAARRKQILFALSQIAADIANIQQNSTTYRTSSVPSQPRQNAAQNHDSSQDYWKQKAAAAEKESNLLPLLHRDQKSYDYWADQLYKMWAGWSTYSNADRKRYQSNMREIRLRWEGKGMGSYFYKSRWETWDGNK